MDQKVITQNQNYFYSDSVENFPQVHPNCGEARRQKEAPLTSNSFLASISPQMNQLNIFFYVSRTRNKRNSFSHHQAFIRHFCIVHFVSHWRQRDMNKRTCLPLERSQPGRGRHVLTNKYNALRNTVAQKCSVCRSHRGSTPCFVWVEKNQGSNK